MPEIRELISTAKLIELYQIGFANSQISRSRQQGPVDIEGILADIRDPDKIPVIKPRGGHSNSLRVISGQGQNNR